MEALRTLLRDPADKTALAAVEAAAQAAIDAGDYPRAYSLARAADRFGGKPPTHESFAALQAAAEAPVPDPPPPPALTPREQARADRAAKLAAARDAAEAEARQRAARGRVDELVATVLAEPAEARAYLALDVHDEALTLDAQVAVEALEVAAQWSTPEQGAEIPGDVEALKLAALARGDALLDALEDESDPDVARRTEAKLLGLRLELHAEAAAAKADEIDASHAAELAKLAIEERAKDGRAKDGRAKDGPAQLTAAQAALERAKAKREAFKARRQAAKEPTT
jgi:hypothetical protein